MARRAKRETDGQLPLFDSGDGEHRGYTYEHAPDGRAGRYQHEYSREELAAYELTNAVLDGIRSGSRQADDERAG